MICVETRSRVALGEHDACHLSGTVSGPPGLAEPLVTLQLSCGICLQVTFFVVIKISYFQISVFTCFLY